LDSRQVQTAAVLKKATAGWQRITSQYPRLFAHWAWSPQSWWTA
jgi:hypothetical protein